jgi:valyl-tRNA synthetase
MRLESQNLATSPHNDNVERSTTLSKFSLSKAYNPLEHEADIYRLWEESGSFKPGSGRDGKKPFTIIMPPPNANGRLHLGHMMFVLEDIMTRYRRMQGHPTLWLPGTDHAGIETQFVYERDVLKPQGKTRFDVGREQLFKDIWAYSTESRETFLTQFKLLGFSADWSRLKYTMDPDIVETVYQTFRQMFNDGLVYRANRIVNWCPTCQAAFSDIEVDYTEREDALYELNYGTIHISTTRPETIFADVAIAVNPDDARYTAIIGQTATIPLTDRPIAIISDSAVLPEFGTGALKITPAHSKEDYEIGRRHNLPEIQTIDKDGKLINVPDEFAGLSVEDGRDAVVSALDDAGFLVSTTPLSHSVAVHDRCGTTIEPLITEQWYVRVKSLVEPTIAKLEANKIAIVPERFKKTTLAWLEQEHDWNISRQTWWGIRIPIYYKASNDPAKEPYICSWDEQEAIDYYGKGNFTAETDTFDTWFSSSQWPYATLQSTGDFGNGFYPTSVMETGRDIMTKWVTKMIWFGLYRTNKIPFHTVYLHGMVTDGSGKKMSKSKGNGIDPVAMTEKFGTDALRLALTIGITPGNDGSLSEAKIEGYRNFCNKLWNVARFILGQLPQDYSPTPVESKGITDDWMLAKINQAIGSVTIAIESYHFSEAGQLIYSLLWDDFADWYLEAAKVSPNHDLLIFGLETIITLLHPIAPFVTEAIWSVLPWHTNQLIVQPWPEVNIKQTFSTDFEQIKSVVQATRTIVSEEGLSKPVIVTTNTLIFEQSELIKRLARVSEVRLVEQGTGLYLGTGSEWIEANNAQITARTSRLVALRNEKLTYLNGLEGRLGNIRYVESAPEMVVQETRDRREETLMLLSKLDEQLNHFN